MKNYKKKRNFETELLMNYAEKNGISITDILASYVGGRQITDSYSQLEEISKNDEKDMFVQKMCLEVLQREVFDLSEKVIEQDKQIKHLKKAQKKLEKRQKDVMLKEKINVHDSFLQLLGYLMTGESSIEKATKKLVKKMQSKLSVTSKIYELQDNR